jgi:hypothetical protein
MLRPSDFGTGDLEIAGISHVSGCGESHQDGFIRCTPFGAGTPYPEIPHSEHTYEGWKEEWR